MRATARENRRDMRRDFPAHEPRGEQSAASGAAIGGGRGLDELGDAQARRCDTACHCDNFFKPRATAPFSGFPFASRRLMGRATP